MAPLASSKLYFNIEIIHKLGIEKNLKLKSELYFHKDIREKEQFHLKMKNGIRLSLLAKYFKDKDVYGPSDKLSLKLKLFGKQSQKLTLSNDGELIIKLGEKKSLVSKDLTNQLIEINLTPEMYR
jgi:hypothetical protein